MNVQIGDTVLVFDWVGGVYAAIVTGFHSENTISCTYFPLLGGIKIFNGLMHKSEAKPLAPYWDFRPSQKVTPPVVKAAWDKTIQEDSVEIRGPGIKLSSSLMYPPVVGTFEWALVALKNGHKVRRLSWKPYVTKWYAALLEVKIDGAFLRFPHNGSIFLPSSNDLLATDWVLA